MAEVRTTSSTGGQKGTKLARFDLVPTGPLTELAEHYGVGASKYASHQWRKGYEWSKSYAALMRHLAAFWAGYDYDVCSNDPEGCSHVDLEGNPFVAVREDACFNHTGSHHMAAVAWHSFLLLEFKDAHQGHDDRYRPEDDSNVLESEPDPTDPTDLRVPPFERVTHIDFEPEVITGVREGFDIPAPEEGLHQSAGRWTVGERAQDLIDAEGPVEHPLRWVKDYDNEHPNLRDFPRVETGLPTLAEAAERFGFFDYVDTSGLQGVIRDEVLRITRAADKRVEDRLREQYGPDLLKKRRPIKDTPQA